ncbi:hypothetical protein J3F83DRAFT_747412 [Trichoderma novae-zelandiae]
MTGLRRGLQLSAARSGWPVPVSPWRRQVRCLATPVSVPALAADGFFLRATTSELSLDLPRIRAYLLQLFHLLLLDSSAAATTLAWYQRPLITTGVVVYSIVFAQMQCIVSTLVHSSFLLSRLDRHRRSNLLLKSTCSQMRGCSKFFLA